MAEKFYLTTSIAYINSSPHLGFAKEIVMADALARYQRLLGKEVYFLTGTDEHGAKISRAAAQAGLPVEKFADQNAGKFRKLAEVLNISFDDFIRTSDKKRHFPGAQKIWRLLSEKGDIYKKSYRGLYCVGHEAFVTEKDLTDGKCADHGQAPEAIEEENYFFKLSAYTERIKKAIVSGELEITPESRKNEILSFLKEGLEDISFSRPARDIPWGVPVPGDAEQTMYVWGDALTNYISALGYGQEKETLFKKLWPANLHIIGKDILRFHAAIWPGMLLSAGLPLPEKIMVHGFITSRGQKMSKTLGNVVDPFDLAERYGAEAVRYYLLREISSFEDGDFTEKKFKENYNANLANGLGNFVSRVSKMIFQYFGGAMEKPAQTALAAAAFKKEMEIEKFFIPEYQKAMAGLDFQKAGDVIWRLIGMLDGYIQDYEPFKLVKNNKEKAQAALWQLAFGMFWVSRLLAPFMPSTAEKIFNILGVSSDILPKNLKIFRFKEHKGLFPRKE
ncbi:MAG: methionine--tRNA ligase [Candidatus Niyogibacteria bacterium]|nr:methionine--tRNA ligase [Candidatus Niyogibacteria bacterium]